MLDNLAVFIDAEDVESDLLARPCKIVNRLQEHLVAILKGTDVVYGGLHLRGSEVFHGTDKRIRAGAVSQIMLNVILRQQAASHVRIAGGEGVDECQRFFRVAQGLCVCRSAKADHGDGNHAENQYERGSLFHFE